MDGLFHDLIPHEIIVSHLFISDRQVFQAKALRMAHLRADGSPAALRRSVGKFDQVQRLVDPFLHILQGGASQAVRVVARRDHGKRLRPDILAELEKFIEAQPKGLIIIPGVPAGRPAVRGAERILPAVHPRPVPAVQGTDMGQAASRKTHKPGPHVPQQAGNVLPQSVPSFQEGVLRKQGHIIQLQDHRLSGKNGKPRRIFRILRC